jgi:hypothetical protein
MKSDPYYFYNRVKKFHETFEVLDYPHPDNAPFEVHKLRARLIEEEFKELKDARTPVDTLDAICDLLYVVAGTACAYSTPLKIVTCIDHTIPVSIQTVLNDLYSMFPCQNHLMVDLSLLIADLENHAFSRFSKYKEAFNAVHENNMDKLWTFDPTASIMDSKRILLYKPKRDKWLVKDAGGKVIKPPSHTKVDLTPYV